jgi:hypothetical protein
MTMRKKTMMTRDEIAKKADDLRVEAARIPAPGMSNYKQVLNTYKRILNDILVLIRDLAR